MKEYLPYVVGALLLVFALYVSWAFANALGFIFL